MNQRFAELRKVEHDGRRLEVIRHTVVTDRAMRKGYNSGAMQRQA